MKKFVVGRRYPLVLGESFASNHSAIDTATSYINVQYAFKPASVLNETRGTLLLSKSGEATLEFQPDQEAGVETVHEKLTMKGSTITPSINDYLLINDNGILRVECLDSIVVGLRPERGQNVGTQPENKPKMPSSLVRKPSKVKKRKDVSNDVTPASQSNNMEQEK